MTLVSSLSKPLHRLGIVAGYAPAVGVHEPEMVLGTGVTLVGRRSKPLPRLGIVAGYAPAVGVHEAEMELGVGFALVGQRTKKPDGRRVVACAICSNSIREGARRDGCAGWNRRPQRTEPTGGQDKGE